MFKKVANYRNPIIALLASSILLSIIFLSTSQKHYNQIDVEYFIYALPKIIAISVIPSLVAWLAKSNKWYFSAFIGCVVGLLSAVAYVQFIKSI